MVRRTILAGGAYSKPKPGEGKPVIVEPEPEPTPEPESQPEQSLRRKSLQLFLRLLISLPARLGAEPQNTEM